LRDSSGNMSRVSLHGLATLTLTSGNNLNAQFLMLTAAPLQTTLTGVLSTTVANQIGLTVNTVTGHSYQLLKSTTANGPYTPVAGALVVGDGQPHTFTQQTSGTQGYFRVQVQ